MSYLYLIRCNEFYKIGIAADVQSRLASLQTGNPYLLEVFGYYQFDNPSPIEQSLHQKYNGKRQSGEWFVLDSEDLKLFEQICFLLGGQKQSEIITVSDDDVSEANATIELTDFLPVDQIPDGAWLEKKTKHLKDGNFRCYYTMRWWQNSKRNAMYLGKAK